MNKSDDESKDLAPFYDVVWKYFQLHANQRIQVFNFYIVMESLFVTGLITLLNSDDLDYLYICVVCVAMILFSIFFSGIDKRTKSMIELAEKSIREIETEFLGRKYNNLKMFNNEYNMKVKFTYTFWFGMMFWFFGIIGFLGLFSKYYL